ncbi:MAG: enoyl-CoA hydratase/isomerase family protein [Acidimicrobiia bacterium]
MELVNYREDDAVAVIELNRPPVNALNPQLISDLGEAMVLAGSESVRAVVITGGARFAAGADITQFKASFDAGSKERQASGLSEVVAQLEDLRKPTIAAVLGVALGGGLELAMGADFRYLGEGARVGQPEILLGLIPGAGGTQRLARIVGPQQCKALCMTGRHVMADEALRIGLADKVAPDDQLMELAMADARTFAAGPTVALAAAKRAIREGFDSDLESGLAIEAEAFAESFASEDARIGVTAFLAKEKPEFSGR